eukprot:2615951-Pyramimonas_sp.AAC.1
MGEGRVGARHIHIYIWLTQPTVASAKIRHKSSGYVIFLAVRHSFRAPSNPARTSRAPHPWNTSHGL